MDAKELLNKIEKLENELKNMMLSNSSLYDLRDVIEVQNRINDLHFEYLNITENGCF